MAGLHTAALSFDEAENGASSVEYGLLVALIAAVITTAVVALGGVTNGTFSNTCTEFRNGVSAAGRPMSASC